MNKGFVQKIAEVFRPQLPLWACELTSEHIVVAGVNRSRSQVRNKLAVDLPPNTITGSLSETNIQNSEAARSTLRDALRLAGFQGSEIAVVLPDDAARIAFLPVEKLSSDPEEQQTFIRWKLKKTVPFDVDTAQVACQVLDRHTGNADLKSTGIDMLITLSPRAIVQEYEELFSSLNIHAGYVVPSTLAALNLLNASSGDTLFLKIAPDCVTTTILRYERISFYRRVTDLSLYDAVYPTVMYYQDKLGGKELRNLVVCGQEGVEIRDLERRLQMSAQRLEPRDIDDVYKPVLGVIHAKV